MGDPVGDEPALQEPAARPTGPVDLHRLDMLRELDEVGTYVARVIDRLEANQEELLAAVSEAIASGDPAALRAAAHALKGTMTNIGLVWAGERAFELEQLGTAGVVAGAEERMPALRAAVTEGLDHLRDYRRSLEGGVAGRG